MHLVVHGGKKFIMQIHTMRGLTNLRTNCISTFINEINTMYLKNINPYLSFLDLVFQQLIKLLHKDTRSFEVSACNLTIVEKSNKHENNRHPPQKQFNVQLYKDTSLGTNVGVRKQHPPY